MNLSERISKAVNDALADIRAQLSKLVPGTTNGQSTTPAAPAAGPAVDLTKLTELETQFGKVKTDLDQLVKDFNAATADKTRLEGELATAKNELKAATDKLNDPKGTIQVQAATQAAETLAQTGLTGAVPIQAAENAGGTPAKTVDALRAELKTCTDPQRKFEISNQIRELTAKKKA